MPLYDTTPAFVEHDAHTNSYVLLVQKSDFFAPLTRLLGFSLTAPNFTYGGAVKIPVTRDSNGKPVTFEKTLRGRYQKSVEWTVGWPQANFIATPLGRLTENLTECTRDYFGYFQCPDDACKSHFYYIKDGLLGSMEPGDWMVYSGDDAVGLEATSPLYAEPREFYTYLHATLAQNTGDALYTAAYLASECSDCDNEPNLSGFYGGGDGVAAPSFLSTSNEWASGTAILPATITTTEVVMKALSVPGGILVGYADTALSATAAAGGIEFSSDGGTTWTSGVIAGVAITTPIFDIVQGRGYIYAVGGSATVLRSRDGVNWTAVALNNAAIPATTFWEGADVDASTGWVWLAGYDNIGTASVAAILIGESYSDISTAVGAGASELFSVKVLAKNHVMYGGAAGILFEHPLANNASASNPFTAVASNSTGAVHAIAGNKARTLIGAGTAILERSALTSREFDAIDGAAGLVITGNVRALRAGAMSGYAENGLNHFVATTDAGEIVVIKGCYSFE